MENFNIGARFGRLVITGLPYKHNTDGGYSYIKYPYKCDYGGRGITIDPKWNTFVGFYNDMGDTYEEGLTIDRIDVNGNYCKENCRWADDHVQGYNRRISNLNTSGKTGVSWHKATKKWYVRFILPDNQKEIGELYEYLWDAVYRRMQLEQLYYGKVKD